MAQILPLTPDNIRRAADALRAGELVAFPTETVYGLGADATNDRAVAAIFDAKGRPHFNPLISHVADMDDAAALISLNATARRIADRFWPGPLSLVAQRRSEAPLSRLVSAGLPTAAIRVPAHHGARTLLRAAGIPVAAPSANLSGAVSPTTARHVADSLGGKIDIILDGGACSLGLESTVVDVSRDAPVLLRAGGVTVEELEDEIGREMAQASSDDHAPKSPGMLTSHYAPARPLRMNATAADPGEALLAFGPATGAAYNLSPSADLMEAAANLFDALHVLDCEPWTGIAVMSIPERGLGRAINDRLRRAAAPRPG